VTRAVPAIGYVRVSTGEQGESGLGLKAQEAAIRAACEMRGWELVALGEEMKSGARADNRPVLAAVIRALRAGEADAVVVAKLDRLSGSVVDAGRLLEDARKGAFNIVALDLGLDLSTPTGELVANVLAAVAQWERHDRAAHERGAPGQDQGRLDVVGVGAQGAANGAAADREDGCGWNVAAGNREPAER
jgi:DNA invertase Pin-like site-specific DNA recombinase